jgi:hypothetical protein
VLEFAKARINEIEEMKKALKTFRGVRRVYQTLPRHLRRRTMGWDVKRMPRRLRNAASREVCSLHFASFLPSSSSSLPLSPSCPLPFLSLIPHSFFF